jgi:S-DNA-T family DNA segregation ATPase FtsK/SpoIIIE
MSDLMLVAGKEIENYIQKLSQMARAAGIHIIMATQRPSVDVITGTIKANFPTRISFQVTSKIDSRTILGEQGAEQLLGKGDMLYMSSANRIVRIHAPFVSENEIEKINNFLRAQAEPDYVDEILNFADEKEMSETSKNQGEKDELFETAVEIIKSEGKASTSFLQRKLQIGYNRAARIIDTMEAEGIVSKANHVGKRDVLK